MQSLYFNEAFFYALPKLLGERSKDFSDRVLGFSQSFSQWKSRGRKINVRDIIRISNGTRIPVRYFVSPMIDGEVHKNAKELVVPDEEWKQVVFDKLSLRQLYESGGTDDDHVLRKTIAELLGTSSYGMWHWLADSGENSAGGIRFTADFDKMMSVCDRFSLPLSMFIRDLNENIPFFKNGVVMQGDNLKDIREVNKQLQKVNKRCQQLVKEKENLQQQLADSKSIVGETIPSFGMSSFLWRSQKWGNTEVPTVRELVRYCRSKKLHLSEFICQNINPISLTIPSCVLLSEETFNVCSTISGKVISPDMLISQFCNFLNDTHLTPSLFFVGTGDTYNRTFADKALALIIGNPELL